MPKTDKIRHNDLTERPLEDTEKLSPRELFNRTVGESHQDDFRTENTQPTSATGCQLFFLSIIPVIILTIIAVLLFGR